jgi:hypothetical protein
VDRVPRPSSLPPRGKGRPPGSSDRLFLQALVIRLVRHRPRVQAWLRVLDEPTAERRLLRALLTEAGRLPTRRPWERRLTARPHTRPAPIGGVGRGLVARSALWATSGRAVAMDRPVLRAHGGVWHTNHRAQGVGPQPSMATEAPWPQSGWHGWVYGWKLHVGPVVAAGWIPVAAELTAATHADPASALRLWPALPPEAHVVVGATA